MDVEQIIRETSTELVELYWSDYEEKTLAFPDTEEGEYAEKTVIELSVIMIVMSYIGSFEKPVRSGVLQRVINAMIKVYTIADMAD